MRPLPSRTKNCLKDEPGNSSVTAGVPPKRRDTRGPSVLERRSAPRTCRHVPDPPSARPRSRVPSPRGLWSPGDSSPHSTRMRAGTAPCVTRERRYRYSAPCRNTTVHHDSITRTVRDTGHRLIPFKVPAPEETSKRLVTSPALLIGVSGGIGARVLIPHFRPITSR